jgi:hypothetical protein
MGARGPTSLIAFAVGGAAIVLVAIVGGFVALKSCGDAPPPPVRATYSNTQFAAEGARAKGTPELRSLGCAQALVVDMERLMGEAGHVRDGEPRFMVTCDVGPTAEIPSCEKVQAVYYGALGGLPEGNVGIRVSRSGATGPACSRLFAPNGADLGPFPAH